MPTAIAHPNIALIKYWGKQDKPGNIPATPNLSLTLSELSTETTLSPADTDELWLNGEQTQDMKVARFLAAVRNHYPLEAVRIDSANNFPTGAGLASSASGFAALVCAINAHLDLGLDAATLSEWARLGSASAARSLFGGYVALIPPQWRAEPIAEASHWPLKVVVGVTSTQKKDISSTKGMSLTKETSPFYSAWVDGAGDDFADAADAIAKKDFEQLAAVSELNCLKMHSIMLTTKPTLAYWNAATVDAMQCIRDLRDQGNGVFFTIDAGPQIKAICLPEAAAEVQRQLEQVPGVLSTTLCGLGPGAYISE